MYLLHKQARKTSEHFPGCVSSLRAPRLVSVVLAVLLTPISGDNTDNADNAPTINYSLEFCSPVGVCKELGYDIVLPRGLLREGTDET